MAKNVRETIKSLTKKHLSEGGRCFGQCLTAVGWVGGTLPELYEEDGMVEFSMADVAGGAIATGIALAGERPIYVVRYQGFQWYNAPSIINYAAKSKEIWDIPCPIFVRSIAMEGGVGPVAGSSHHSMYERMPGLKVVSPMTPLEYERVYHNFMKDDVPYYVSEHRKSYDNTEEMQDEILADADIVLLPVSVTRFSAIEAKKKLENMGYKVSIVHHLWIKPLLSKEKAISALINSKFGGLVTDDDYEQGTATSIAHQLMIESKKAVDVIGLENRTAGFHPSVDVFPPSADDIVKKSLELIKNEV
jgi:pyruvate/2-oxoglutarate/acetoin dehydrogenase E1 component